MIDNTPKVIPTQISLVPLTREHHVDALQQVYRGVEDYWSMYDLALAPYGQAELDLNAMEVTPGRAIMGMVLPLQGDGKGAALIGIVDFRMHWPDEDTTYIGMIMVAAPYRRQGIGSQAWKLLGPWLANDAKLRIARCGVEQFNLGALQFYQSLGFELTGEANRIQSGDKLVRLLYLEQAL